MMFYSTTWNTRGPCFYDFLWCLFRGFDRSYSFKGRHVVHVIEIPVNLSSFWFTPLPRAYFLEYLMQKWVANKAKIF